MNKRPNPVACVRGELLQGCLAGVSKRMNHPTVKTWEAKIYVGLRKGYTSKLFDITKLMGVCQGYFNHVG